MICPKGETRPLCKWKEHVWVLLEYLVSGLYATRRYQCSNCGRIQFRELSKGELK